MKTPHQAFVLIGPTAVGKTAVAEHIAEIEKLSILSADSMLVYRGMDIGTAKPPASHRARYFGLDLVDPDSKFSVGDYIERVKDQVANLKRDSRDAQSGLRKRSPYDSVQDPVGASLDDARGSASSLNDPTAAGDLIVTGGTGLYVKCLIEGLRSVPTADAAWRNDAENILAAGGVPSLKAEVKKRAPEQFAALRDPENPRRLIRAVEMARTKNIEHTFSRSPRPTIVGLQLPAAVLQERIRARVEKMYRDGLLEEVVALRERFPAWSETARQAIGYAEALTVRDGQCTLLEAKEKTILRTRQLAKRQMTWFKRQAAVDWIDVPADASPSTIAVEVQSRGKNMGQLHSLSEDDVERALLVGVEQDKSRDLDVHDSVDELAQLCETAGAQVVERLFCRIHKPNPATFVGKGKAQEIADLVKEKNLNTVVFDDDLSAAQGRNLEKVMGVKVVDRTQVILDIFAQHARSREGQMQIELAQLEYLLPRLKRMWTHLERQKGGVGMHGPGESQLEMDRRRILEKIVRYRTHLKEVRARRAEQRRGRRRHGWALVSLVGYTNAGKSTLINALTGSEVLAHDQLFATLDPTTRKLELPNHQPALVTDTVGFIRKLPHHLVESFKATLEEVQEADLLVHVIDASHPLVDQQIKAVLGVLRELGVHEKPILSVLNKMDREEARQNRPRLADLLSPNVAVSATKGEGFDDLRNALADALRNRHQHLHLRVPLTEGKLLAAIRSSGTTFAERYEDDAAVLDVAVPERLRGACAPYVMEAEAATHGN